MPDVICHGGGELSESRHGESGADGQRPDTDTPETNSTSAEELSATANSEGNDSATEGGSASEQSTPDTPGEETEGPGEQPEPEFITPISFKTSGTFLRDKVARHLAEQGFDTDEGAGAAEESSVAPEEAPPATAEDPGDAAGTAPSGPQEEDPRSGGTADTEQPPAPVSALTEPLSLASVRAEADRPGAQASSAEEGVREDSSESGAPASQDADASEAGGAEGESDPARGEESAPDSSGGTVAGTVTDVQDFSDASPAPDGEGEQKLDEDSAAETASLWPEPQRLSAYVADSSEDASASDEASAAAGASSAGERAAKGSSGPGGPKGPSGPGGTGPGGPKGPGDPKASAKKKGKSPLWWRILRVFLIVTGVFVLIGCGVFAYLYNTVEVPDAAKADALEQGSTFYFADGETEFAYRGTNREIIDYDQMTEGGDHVVEAMISAEDRGFWTEPGVSLRGTTRAVWSTITGQQVQGGSTITQQMVRNYYEGVSRDVSIVRKVKEIIIAIKVDRSESKEWVMQQYLNTIYFGRNAYGVQAAAEAYYHKDVSELEPGEAAFLAAAIQQPTHFGEADVETTPGMERRWEYVVNGMVETGEITQAEADAMEFPAPEPERPVEGTDLSGYKGYMLQEAVNELERLGYTEDQINRQGYSIVTTFDEEMMETAYETVEETVPPENLPEGVNLGLTTIDPATGEVLAFYGGHDYWENQYDSAFLGAAQTGSAFKPYVLATALEQGYSLNSRVDGRGPRTIAGSRIQNAGNAPGGVMTLTEATRQSNNLGFIELAQEVGFENIRDTVYAAGWPDGSIPDSQLVPVMPLGAASARPVDQASGFATFANEGEHFEAHVIREIVNTDGENERPEVEGEQVMEPSTAADVTHALQQVVNSGTGTAARLANHPTAGKTGTTNGSVAAWFNGYTPQLATSVGVYSGNNESFSIPGHNISGGGLPATLWNRYMSRAMEGYEPGSFPSPAFGGTTENWAPDVSTEQPQDQPEGEQPEEPEVPEAPEAPEVPEQPEDPGVPEDSPDWPEMPGPDPGDGDEGGGDNGEVEPPPGRGDEGWW